MSKKFYAFGIVAVLLIVTSVFCLCACDGEADNQKTYIQKVEAYRDADGNPLFADAFADAHPQTVVYDIVSKHLAAPLAQGKTTKKVLFLGYDGCRVDVLKYALAAEKEAYADGEKRWNETKKNVVKNRRSGLMLLRENGGQLKFTYSGGEKGGATQQATSTAPSWATMLTGKWAKEDGGHGVADNGMYKPASVKTFLTEAAESGYSASFTTSWREHQARTYQYDIEYAIVNNLDVTYTHCPDDAATFYDVLARVADPNIDTDVIFCTIEGTDHAGHDTKFGIQHPEYIEGFTEEDDYGYRILSAIYNRPSYAEEDWCIVISTDHGGYKYSHGGQSIMERATWLCTDHPRYMD